MSNLAFFTLCAVVLPAHWVVLWLIIRKVNQLRRAAPPVDMLLFCPQCAEQHIDAVTETWSNPPHRTHLCNFCGHLWRPSEHHTNGVAKLSTQHKPGENPRPRYFKTARDFEQAIASVAGPAAAVKVAQAIKRADAGLAFRQAEDALLDMAGAALSSNHKKSATALHTTIELLKLRGYLFCLHCDEWWHPERPAAGDGTSCPNGCKAQQPTEER